MKITSLALATSIVLATGAAAKSDTDDIEHPVYKPYSKKLTPGAFFEQFDDDWKTRWKVSHAKKNDEFTYNGEWNVEESTVNPGFKGDKGLVVKSEAAHHAISAKLPEVFDNTNDTLVLQYEVKLQNGLDCGGAYIKLLSAEGQPEEFNNESPYQVMFGPDKCATTNKVHFIIRRKNPNTGEYEEKALQVPPMGRIVKTTSLYTLIIKPTQEFEIRIDGDVVRAGSFDDERFFNFKTEAEIDDPNDEKPEDWVDQKKIRDPDAVKPEDWDEDAPYLIADPDATKPADWDESASTEIPDPKAEKPEFWDDEEDGKWEAPTIPNPACEEHGCGEWTAPTIKNPAYKGKWLAPLIDNPAYKGEWAPRKIPNPAYYEDKTPSNLEPIGSLGFELWTMTDSILFDNIYLGHSIEEAETIGNDTFVPKLAIEEKVAAASAPKPQFDAEEPPSLRDQKEEKSAISKIYDETIGQFVESAFELLIKFNFFVNDVVQDPVNTLLERPVEAFIYSGVFVSALTFAFASWAALMYLLTKLFTTPLPQAPVAEKKSKKEPKIVEVEDEKDTAKASDSKKNETEAVKRQ
ncbi:unnamed protein product [Ambrosiozyma monospora]|uniref:Unnamed protein product n=1 Tax=Ambrosiozyma monospora TaxID=43982 RepID=A0ACB5SSI4_AMBMO|nr:unnamed protein product [Ambrosiozyma monospora]